MKIARIVRLYETPSGKKPFLEWVRRLDKTFKMRILDRLKRVKDLNLGDSKFVGEGVRELRLAFGPGFRVYYGADGTQLIILLCGGDKSSQTKDIEKAKKYWRAYKEQKYGKIQHIR